MFPLTYETPSGDPGAIRTRDLQIRNLLLYPAELRDRRVEVAIRQLLPGLKLAISGLNLQWKLAIAGSPHEIR